MATAIHNPIRRPSMCEDPRGEPNHEAYQAIVVKQLCNAADDLADDVQVVSVALDMLVERLTTPQQNILADTILAKLTDLIDAIDGIGRLTACNERAVQEMTQ